MLLSKITIAEGKTVDMVVQAADEAITTTMRIGMTIDEEGHHEVNMTDIQVMNDEDDLIVDTMVVLKDRLVIIIPTKISMEDALDPTVVGVVALMMIVTMYS